MGFGGISQRAGCPLTALAYAIMLRLHRSVRDDTGFTGRYDFDVRLTPDEVLTLAASRPPGQVRHAIGSDEDTDPNGPSLMTALRCESNLASNSTPKPAQLKCW